MRVLLDECVPRQLKKDLTVDRDFGSTYTGVIPLGIVILAAGTTDPTLLRPHMPAVLEALRAVKRGEVRRVPVR